MFDSFQIEFPIVGVGASAGGLEAFADFLGALPAASGMAFVLIQHLDPEQKSLLPELLGRKSPISVEEAKDGQKLEPNRAYTLPPKMQATVAEGILRLEANPESGEPFRPIDVFFRSLAFDAGEFAIGIVLSGTGQDGSEGIATIRKHGGMTYAQSPSSARFDEMPLAAIAAGANGSLDAGSIAKELVSVLSSRTVPESFTALQPQNTSLEDRSFRLILQALYESKGLNFALYKGQALKRRVQRRMEKQGFQSFSDYISLLRAKQVESDSVYEDLLIKVTSFFRDKETFEHLRSIIVPSILAKKGHDKSLKVWVPGCASGEEVYSLAISLFEAQTELLENPKFEIFGTDISEAALAVARLGEFDASISKCVSQERLDRFFSRTESGFKILPIIRNRCVFSKQNVAQDPPISGVDLISCRNLMIYFRSMTQRIVLEKFHYALHPWGRLVLGNAEDTLAAKGLFHCISREHRIFEVQPSNSPIMRLPRPASLQTVEDDCDRRVVNHVGSLNTQTELTAQVDQVIQSAYVPPGVVLNDSFEVLQFRGDTSPFLVNPPGSRTNEVFKMCRNGLADVMQRLVDRASTSGQRERAQAKMRIGNRLQSVQVDLIPFAPTPVFSELQGNKATPRQHCYIALFSLIKKLKTAKVQDIIGASAETDRLRTELAETKGYLGSLMLQKQQAIEELRSANEEIHSANEELQSSNQELAAAREETLIANDELRKVNQDLKFNADELMQLNADFVNLLGSLLIPVVIVSDDFRIKLFTDPAAGLFNLSPDSRGKSATFLSEQPGFENIGPIVEDVLRNLSFRECEVLAADGHWYCLRARPYRTETNQVKGVILAFFDVSEIKKNHQAMRAERDLSQAIIMQSPSPLLILDGNFRIVSTNRAFDDLFGLDSKEFLSMPVFSLWGARWNSSTLRSLLQSDWDATAQLSDYPLQDEFPLEKTMHVTLSTSKIDTDKPESSRYILSFNDLSVERKLREAAEKSWAVALAANQAKSEFLANMSHEMRSPLTAIMGFSETIADEGLSESERRDYAARIIRNGQDLLELIDDILDLSKIEAGKLKVEPVEFDLASLFEEVFGLLQVRAAQAGAKLDVALNDPIPARITSCRRRLRQIILNVVGNAIKFTSAGGEVKATINAQHGALVIEVADTGCGIAKEKQTLLFNPFSQADASISRRYGGTGLGLSLSRQLARALGGDVILVRSTEGVGSVFKITVAIGATEHAPPLQAPAELAKELNERSKEALPAFKASTRLAEKHILLVEDSQDNRKIIGLFLTQSGATVSYAANGFEAIACAEKTPCDLILMDVQMPSLDGYSATRRLRNLGYTLPILALTANAMLGEQERALKAGCDGYISKPVRGRFLIDTIERYLHQANGCC